MPKPKNDTDERTEHQGNLVDNLTVAARRAADRAEASPLTLVAGGIALGALVGAVLPRSERERQLLAPVGERLGAGVAAAIDAGREAGKAELADAGIGRDAAREQVRNLIDGLLKAATSAGSAAAQAAATTAGKSAG